MQKKQGNTKKAEPGRALTFLSGQNLLLLAGILFITYFSFSPVLKNGFINWDDNAYVFNNPHLAKPLPEAISYFFGQNYFIGNYIPLTMIVYTAEHHMAGLDPQFYHKVNLFIHLANCILVFWFTFLLSGKKSVVAGLVAILFAIHPMHVESVAWVAELKDVLYAFFFLAALITYYKFLERKRADAPKALSLLLLTLFFFILSLLSKPAAAIFPLVILLLDHYTGRTLSARVWLEKLPFFLLSVLFGIIAIKAQQADNLLHNEHGLFHRFLFASYALIQYLFKFFLPFNLSVFYPYPEPVDGHLPVIYYIAPFLAALLGYGIYRFAKRSRLLAFGALFFLFNLLLVLQVISVGDAIMAERYTYIPYIGLFFVLAMAFDTLYHSNDAKLRRYRPAAIGAVVVVILGCSFLTHARTKVWKNDDSVATDLITKFPEDRLALNNKGFILYEQGRHQESLEFFIKAIAIKPDYTRAYINLANSYMALNDYPAALKTTEDALKQSPEDYNLLTKKAFISSKMENYDQAIKFYKMAIAREPENMSGYLSLSECYYFLKDYDSGIKIMDEALTREPENYMLLNNKGYFLFLKGNYSEAVTQYKAALNEKPDYATASVNLENCYRAMNDSARVK